MKLTVIQDLTLDDAVDATDGDGDDVDDNNGGGDDDDKEEEEAQ